MSAEFRTKPHGDKTASAAGKRPAPLEEVAQPQEGAVIVGYMAASVLLLGVPRLQGDDGVDDRTVRLLPSQAEPGPAEEGKEVGEGAGGEGERGGGGAEGGEVAGGRARRRLLSVGT